VCVCVCVCVWYGERMGEKTKDMSGRVGSVAGTSSDMSFGADQTVVVSVRPSVVLSGGRGAGARDITIRQDRDEERGGGGRQGRRRRQSP